MTFQEFIDKWTGKPVDTDGVYPNQCMDLMHQYVYECLGLTDKLLLAAPSASQVFENFKPDWGQYFDKIDNTNGVPKSGDIVFFGTEIGPYGHVCIFCSGNATSFNSFDSNWPIGTLPHAVTHNYIGVLGWLHPKALGETIPVDKKVFEMLVDKATKYDDFEKNGFTTVEDATNSINNLLKMKNEAEFQLEARTNDLVTSEAKVADLQAQLNSLNEILNNPFISFSLLGHSYKLYRD